ncbi:MAG: hypothetical protein SGPRY_008001 [Prymnesium sp.]
MADALESGACAAAAEMECGAQEFSLVRKRAADASVDDLLRAEGYLFCAPENLASVSGEMLEFFHRSYYHAFAHAEGDHECTASLLTGRPFGIAIAAGNDGSMATKQMERICRDWTII